MDLVFALDDRFQTDTIEPQAVEAVSRLLGVDTIWISGDVAYDRFRLARPEVVIDELSGHNFLAPALSGLRELVDGAPASVQRAAVPLWELVAEQFGLDAEALAEVGITDIAVVTGHAAGAIDDVKPTLEERYGLTLDLRFNERYSTWNNAYSVWLVRDVISEGAILINGDTVHPVDVERRLLAARGDAPVLLAVDDDKTLGEEEMKVHLEDGRLTRINKAIDPPSADGEYIGVTLFEPDAGAPLACRG
jgi:hypothetical protein